MGFFDVENGNWNFYGNVVFFGGGWEGLIMGMTKDFFFFFHRNGDFNLILE